MRTTVLAPMLATVFMVVMTNVALHTGAAPAPEPCQQLNVSVVPEPTFGVTKAEVALADRFLALLANNASLPRFNATLKFSADFAATVGRLVGLARAYPAQAVDTVQTHKATTLFCDALNATHLAALAGVYQAYQAAAADPRLQAQIKARFEADQQRWIAAAKAQASAVVAAASPWMLSGPGLEAYNALGGFLGQCQGRLADDIAALEGLIAELTKSCGHPCPALDKARRDLAEAEADLVYCGQGAEAFAVELAGATHQMTGKLWGVMLGLMRAVADDLGSSIASLAQLDLDNVIFGLTLQEAVIALRPRPTLSFTLPGPMV